MTRRPRPRRSAHADGGAELRIDGRRDVVAGARIDAAGAATSGSFVVSLAALTRVKQVCSKMMLFWSVTRDGCPASPAGLKIVASGSDARATHAPPRAICSEPLSGNSVTFVARARAGRRARRRHRDRDREDAKRHGADAASAEAHGGRHARRSTELVAAKAAGSGLASRSGADERPSSGRCTSATRMPRLAVSARPGAARRSERFGHVRPFERAVVGEERRRRRVPMPEPDVEQRCDRVLLHVAEHERRGDRGEAAPRSRASRGARSGAASRR